MVFVVSYLLILPALTLDHDEANQHAGINLETETVNAETNTLSYTGEAYEVEAAYSKAAQLPEKTTLQVSEITKKNDQYQVYCDKALKAVQNADEDKKVTGFSFVKLYDISLMADGAEVEPNAPLNVSISYDKGLEAKRADHVRVIHFDEDSGKAEAKPEILDNSHVDVTIEKDKMTEASFEADSFSVYGVVYTVDFEYEVDGNKYTYSIEGGSSISLKDLLTSLQVVQDDKNTEVNEVQLFADDVQNVAFSSPDLVRVDHTDQGWTLTSLKPFKSTESLTVTMKNGDVFTVKVTDAQEIPDSSATTIDVNKSHLICYQTNGQYYLLKNDGTVDSSHTPADFENLNSTYCWTLNYVFEEKHLEETLTYTYYLIRPIDNKSKTIALNAEGEALVQRSNNNVAIVPAEGGGFHLIGYNEVKLNFENGAFSAKQFPEGNDGIVVHIYEMETLPTYSYTARSSDEERGTVQIAGGTEHTEAGESGTTHYYEAESSPDKKNAGAITAVPVNHQDSAGHNKWIFDHWTQDGIPLDRDQYPATINANTLPIPFNGSRLIAYFKQNPQYIVPENEKEPTTFDDMSQWLDDLTTRHVPLDEKATEKTAEVYDYENRIYRVDIASDANFRTFNGNVDMAFCMDVSNSMYFPSKLVEYRNNFQIYRINTSNNTKRWLDQSRTWDNPYYLIADGSNTATVFKVYYQDGNWKAQDASRETESDKSFIIGQAFETTWTSGETDKTHPFNAGDNDYSSYTIYNAGDNGRNRFYYLNQSFSGATSDLTTIKNTLEVAGADSPQVRIAYNTFNKELGSQRQDFQTVRPITGIDLSNSHGGGTRPDQAFNDADSNFAWQGDDRYVILITDGAPQGKRTGESLTPEQIVQAARDAAVELKKGQDGIAGTSDDVKVITVGLSMENVISGKRLLYDLADLDKEGNKMFYMAESASDLPNILRQIIDTIMDDAVVFADVTDTVGDAFYPVDKNTGLPLQPGEMIDIEGRIVTDSSQAAGVILEDGKTIKWLNQSIDPQNGWHGTVYVKAKEDLLGGNAVKTNGNADITATKYRMGDQTYTFNDSLIHDKLKSLHIDLPTPRVNVNELTFPSESTEWTVYLGTEVDPGAQLKQMYESIPVTQVINTDGSLHYSLSPNSISDDRTPVEGSTAKTFLLANTILNQIKEDQTLSSKYVQNGELKWTEFLTDVLKPEGVTVPYHPYGIEGEDSNIVIKLTEEILEGEENDVVGHSPHSTTVLNGENDTPVEKYVLTIQYNPDYDHVLPAGQGGHGNYDFHTGTYGSMYQGHAAGRETSTNTHVINVFAKGMRITKTDLIGNQLAGAEFKLYRTAKADDPEIEIVTIKDKGGNDISVVEVRTFEKQGEQTILIPALKKQPDGYTWIINPVEQLDPDQKYYLVEDVTPSGFNKLVDPIEVSLEITDSFTPLPGTHSQDTKPDEGIYNWTQTAVLTMDEDDSAVKRTDKDRTEDLTHKGLDPDSRSTTMYYDVKNNPGVELPYTGGYGTTLFYILGSILTLGAGMMLIRRRRKA